MAFFEDGLKADEATVTAINARLATAARTLEAAAATAVVMDTTSAPLYREVVVDRPFLFVVHDVEHLTPLFVGRVSDPTV